MFVVIDCTLPKNAASTVTTSKPEATTSTAGGAHPLNTSGSHSQTAGEPTMPLAPANAPPPANALPADTLDTPTLANGLPDAPPATGDDDIVMDNEWWGHGGGVTGPLGSPPSVNHLTLGESVVADMRVVSEIGKTTQSIKRLTYEEERAQNIARNNALMKELGLDAASENLFKSARSSNKSGKKAAGKGVKQPKKTKAASRNVKSRQSEKNKQ